MTAARPFLSDPGRVRAPMTDGGVVIDPSPAEVPALLEANARALSAAVDVQGESLSALRGAARGELIALARRYTAQYRDVIIPSDAAERAGPLFMAGHQPQLFHAGVWFKNFVLAGLAERHAGTALNLVIDGDTLKSAGARVPSGTVERPIVETVLFDRPSEEIPYEERGILDRETWRTFGSRAAESLRPLLRGPLLEEFWPSVVERGEATGRVGLGIAQARHRLEGEWGLRTLELPQSLMCESRAFRRFASVLLARLPRFAEIYNAAVADYRRQFRVRSANHPAPDLERVGALVEAPFWVYRTDTPRRQRLFVERLSAERVRLTDRGSVEIELPLSEEGPPERAIEALGELAARGIRLRSRALITTLFARLMVGDAFMHGIGGGKYDRLTDQIMAEFLGVTPPGFMTVSATLRLPIEHARTTSEEVRALEHELREAAYHPERLFVAGRAPSAEAAKLVEEKRRWVATEQTRANGRARRHAIHDLNQRLLPHVAARREELRAAVDLARRAARRRAALESREYAFCLYPADKLRNFLLDFGYQKVRF